MLRQLSLWDKKDNQIRELSGGMKRRVLIAKALAHDPRVLFLDEPTAGLDPHLSQSFVQLIHTLRAEMKLTIVMITHDLDTLTAIYLKFLEDYFGV